MRVLKKRVGMKALQSVVGYGGKSSGRCGRCGSGSSGRCVAIRGAGVGVVVDGRARGVEVRDADGKGIEEVAHG